MRGQEFLADGRFFFDGEGDMICRLLLRLLLAGLCVVFGGAAVLAFAVFFGGAGQMFGHDLAFYGIVDMRPHLLAGVLVAVLWLAVVIGFSRALCAFRGLSCISMLIEGQSRYKYLVLPYVFVIASSMRCRLACGAVLCATATRLIHKLHKGRSPKREGQ